MYKEVEIVHVGEVVYRKMDDEGMLLTVDMVMRNPNMFDVTVTGCDLKVVIKDKIFGTADIVEHVLIPSFSEEKHRFVIHTSYSELIRNNLNEIFNIAFQDSISVNLRGDVKAKALFFSSSAPIDVTQTVKL